MRSVIFYLMIFWTGTILAQGELVHSSVKVNMTTPVIAVEQFLELNLPDSIQNIEIKVLNFKNVTLSLISAKSEGKILPIEIITSKGLQHFKLSSLNSIRNITLNYNVFIEGDAVEIPIFFTDLPAASSENDFFKAELKTQTNHSYDIQFPKVTLSETIENEIKTIKLEIPALPSVLKAKRTFNEKLELSFLSLVDGFVALIFVVIGILIWKNRKRLIYG